MKVLRIFLLFIFLGKLLIPITWAKANLLGFITPHDVMDQTTSNINLYNDSRAPVTVYGLYIRQYAYVTPGDTCNHATVMYPAAGNITVGSVVTPVVINAGKSAAVGSNYLYNMIYAAIYYVHIIVPSSPPGCSLPGCTWGNDTTSYNWCIYLGALAPVSASPGYTANVPPSSDSASSVNYNYNLISDYIYLGPISCDDQTLTCAVLSQQTQPIF